MREVNLLRSYPKSRRNIDERNTAQTDENIRIARRYGWEYFDGSRDTGYGGYVDDGRWEPVSYDIVSHFQLYNGSIDKFLDVGCAKGFLVKQMLLRDKDAFGLDISSYAVRNCPQEISGRLHLGNCMSLPFRDNSFAAVTAINVVHNLDYEECIVAVREIQRVSGGRAYIQVDSYKNAKQFDNFRRWVLTAKTHGTPEFWVELLNAAGYAGDYGFTIVE